MQRYFSYTVHVTAQRLKKLDLRSGSRCHTHFVGFFNVPVQAPTRATLFLRYSEKPFHLVAFYDTLGIWRTQSQLNPQVLTGEKICARHSASSNKLATPRYTQANGSFNTLLSVHQRTFCTELLKVSLSLLVFNVTCNDISVIYVTALNCAGGLKKFDLRSGSKRHRHFVGLFNVPVQAPTRDNPFYTVIPTHRPIQSPFTASWGYGDRVKHADNLLIEMYHKSTYELSREHYEHFQRQ